MTEGVFKDDDVLVSALGGAYSATITVKIHKLHTNEMHTTQAAHRWVVYISESISYCNKKFT